jgi:hypothetical protein
VMAGIYISLVVYRVMATACTHDSLFISLAYLF